MKMTQQDVSRLCLRVSLPLRTPSAAPPPRGRPPGSLHARDTQSQSKIIQKVFGLIANS